MNNPLIYKKNLTMGSKEIADLTGKHHRHVLRDIRDMLKELKIQNPDLGAALSTGVTATVRPNKSVEEYHLNEELTLTLLTGYSIPLRKAVVSRWKQLEAEQEQARAHIQYALHPHPRINRAVAGYLHNIQVFNYALIQNQLFEDGIRQLYRDRDEAIQGSAMFVEALEQIKHSDDPKGRAVALLQEHAEGERKMQERIADLERRIQKNNEIIAAVTAEDPLLPAMFNQGTKVSVKKLAYDVWMARRLGADGEESFQLSELIK